MNLPPAKIDQDKYKKFIRKYLKPLRDLFITPCREFIICPLVCLTYNVTHLESHERISECTTFRSLVFLLGTLTKRSYRKLEAIIDIHTTYTP